MTWQWAIIVVLASALTMTAFLLYQISMLD